MDLTWTLYAADRKVRFVPEAVCYPIEPHNLEFLGKQLRRWSHGFIQGMRLHCRSVLPQYLRSVVAVVFWDALLASLAYLVLIPVLAVVVDPLGAAAYLDRCARPSRARAVAGVRPPRDRTSSRRFPSFFLLRLVNALFMLAVWRELIVRRPLLEVRRALRCRRDSR